MANSEGPVGQPPAAWVWSHYCGVVADAQTPAPAAAAPAHAAPDTPAPPVAARDAEEKNSTLIGAGIAAAVLVIAGLTWLFTSQPASSPAPAEPTPAASESAPVKSEAAPPAAATPTPAAEPEASKAPAPAAHDHSGKKKKH
jgi:hypothetical protein